MLLSLTLGFSHLGLSQRTLSGGILGDLLGFRIGPSHGRASLVAFALQLGSGRLVTLVRLGGQTVGLRLGNRQLLLGGTFSVLDPDGDDEPFGRDLLGDALRLGLGSRHVPGRRIACILGDSLGLHPDLG